MKRVKLPNGRKIFTIDKHTAIDVFKEIYDENYYLRNGIQIKSGDVIFDIGANIGLFSLFVSEKVNDVHIYAFEPIPPIFEALTANLVNNSADIRLFNIGLADKEGTLDFNYYPRTSGNSSPISFDYNKQLQMILEASRKLWYFRIIPYRSRKWMIKKVLNTLFKSVKISCPLKTLSQIIEENAIKSIDFLKLDAENCEELVLNGIKAEDWHKIRQMTIEVHTNIPNGENLVNRIESLLKEKGFSFFLDDKTRFSPYGVHLLYAMR